MISINQEQQFLGLGLVWVFCSAPLSELKSIDFPLFSQRLLFLFPSLFLPPVRAADFCLYIYFLEIFTICFPVLLQCLLALLFPFFFLFSSEAKLFVFV